MRQAGFCRPLAAAALIGIGMLGFTYNADAQYRGYGMGGGMMGGSGAGQGPGYGYNSRQGPSELNSRAGQTYAQTCSRCQAKLRSRTSTRSSSSTPTPDNAPRA